MKAKWICSLFTAFLFSWNGFAEEGVPCPDSPQNAPSAPSTSSPSTSTGPSAAPSTGTTTDPTTVKDQMGLTLNPDGAGKKGSVTDPNLVGVSLPKVDKFNLIFGNDLAGQYVRFLNYLKQLDTAKKEAKMNERVRMASWEKNSGLDHAKEQFDKTNKRLEEVSKKSEIAEDKAYEAMEDYSKWERQRDLYNRDLRDLEQGSQRWYDTLEKSMKWEKQEPQLKQARQDAWNHFRESKKEADAVKQETHADLNRVNQAMDSYKNMEANYRASRDVPTPKPQD